MQCIVTKHSKTRYVCQTIKDSLVISECQINVVDDIWTISSWFTKLCKYLYESNNMPKRVTYIWNGVNEYVLNWIENNFDAVCTCPLAIQKTQADDDYSSHIYELDTDKFLKYFSVC